MAEKKKYNSILVSGRKDQTLTYSKYVKDEESGESVKESLDKKVNVTDELETQQIKDGAITNEKMAADSIGNTNLQDGSVSNEKLEDGSITNEKLAENAITKDKLKDNTIGVEKLDPELRQAINAATGLPEGLVETIQNVDDTLKDHQSQLDDKQSQIDDKQQQITANDEDISLLQTRSTQMEESIKGIAATGGASQATAVTYENENSKLTAINIQSAVDEVVDKTAIKDEEGTLVETPFRYIQNEEFIFAKVDSGNKLLFGIQWDGTPKFGKTSAVEDRLQSQVTLLAERVATIIGDEDATNVIDTMNELKKFFAEIENTETLTDILANLNKTTIKDEEGNVQDTPFRVIENEEFIMAVVDSEDRILFGIYRATGKPYYPLNDMYHIAQSKEFLWVILDTANHPLLGIQQDGTCWAAKAQWLDDIKAIKEALSGIDENLKTFQPKEDGKGLINLEIAGSFFYISNDEYIIAVVDAENKILTGIKYDGEPYFPNHEMYSVITNDEWLYAIIDAENKVLGGFRADDGHMIIGGIDISTFIANTIIDIANIKERTAHLSTIENDEYLSVEKDAEGKMIGNISPDGSHYLYKVKSETIPTEFEHIEDDEGRTEITIDAEGKVLSKRDSTGVLQEYVGIKTPFINIETINGQKVEDWRSTNVSLIPREYDLPKYGHVIMSKELSYIYDSVNYAPKDIAKVENKYYVKDSLVDGAVVETSKEVSIIENDINLSSWTVDKTTKHYLKVDIDFGTYLKGTFFIETKYQGNSTLFYDKKNFRYTFYEDILFTKKKSIKIGELISAKKFNLKAYWRDKSLLREHACYRIIQAIRETRPYTEQYPWNKEYNINTCATGITNGFPIRIDVGKSFQGIYWFGLAKDINNFMLSDKKYNGVLIQGDGGYSDKTFWQVLNTTEWSDLLGDIDNNIGENSLSAVEDFYRFLNTDFNKETASEYLNVDNWIDCIIILQFFGAIDMLGSNMILYAGADKKVFSPMYYDMDWTWGFRCKSDVSTFDSQNFSDKSIWIKIQKVFWEEICNRYNELRKLVINDTFIDSLLNKISRQIPYSDYEKEMETWQDVPFQGNEKDEGRYGTINDMVTWEKERIEFMDKYFKIKK